MYFYIFASKTFKGIGNNLFISSIFWIPPHNWTTAISLTGVSILSAKSENSGSKISNLLIRRKKKQSENERKVQIKMNSVHRVYHKITFHCLPTCRYTSFYEISNSSCIWNFLCSPSSRAPEKRSQTGKHCHGQKNASLSKLVEEIHLEIHFM